MIDKYLLIPNSDDLKIEDPATYERNLLLHRINTELVPEFEEAGRNNTNFHSYDVAISESVIQGVAKGAFTVKYLAPDNQTTLTSGDEEYIKDRAHSNLSFFKLRSCYFIFSF